MPSDPLLQQLETAINHHRAGRLDQAEPIYRRILSTQPANVDAMHLLGLIALQTGHGLDALHLIDSAAQLAPARADILTNLGVAQNQLGQPAAAITTLRRAIEVDPNLKEAHLVLADALASANDLTAAEAVIDNFFRRWPEPNPLVLGKLGLVRQQLGRIDDAIETYHQALRLDPNVAHTWHNLAIALGHRSRGREAVEAASRAATLLPDSALVHDQLGASFLVCGLPAEAAIHIRKALELDPKFAEAWFHLGNAQHLLGKDDQAMEMYRKALELSPNHGDALTNLATMLHTSGRIAEALEIDRRAIALVTDQPRARSRMLYSMNFLPEIDKQTIFEAHKEWGTLHAEPLRPPFSPKPKSGEGRRLRIGYVSPDFTRHAVSSFFEPLLNAHDREHFEIFCYSSVPREDEVTKRLRASAEHWREITTISDDAAAALIRADEIDILVDLAGHTDRNRLSIFPRCPAPLQMTYLGYPNTTGVPAIDLRITDAVADPPDVDDAFYVERLARLPRTAWCYRAPNEAPEVAPPPSTDCAVTFCSFNSVAKHNDRALALWAEILRAVPGSRLLLKSMDLRDPAARQRMLDLIVSHDVAADRVEILPPADTIAGHLATYARADIALDTTPYTGTTTTCDALWMGLPVITLKGDRHVSRVSTSLLTAIGLTDLIAETKEDYIRIALDLANDPARRAELRQSLRERMSNSPLMNATTLARAIEAVYKDEWAKLAPVG